MSAAHPSHPSGGDRSTRPTDSERLTLLLDATTAIVSELSLSAVLRRVVDSARMISGARYAALGVLGADGTLEEFLHSGVTVEQAAAIGELPRGRGLLGAVISESQPIRLDSISQDPRSAGFPAHHPEMQRFLGVPIRSREVAFGNLYLADRVDGAAFTAEDEELVLALAATAGIAVENARLYEESRRQQEWLRASAEITRDLLRPYEDEAEVLPRVASSVQRLADADSVLIAVRADSSVFEVAAASGPASARVRYRRFPVSGSLTGRATENGRAVQIDPGELPGSESGLLAEVTADRTGSVVALPLVGEQRADGAIVLIRDCDRPRFAAADVQMAEAFAGQAALALELADARADQQRIVVLEDRDRIARDLHDHVIQRLFAIGLGAQSMAASLPRSADQPVDHPSMRDRLTEAVGELDETIRQIRTSIFALRESRVSAESVRAAVMDMVEELSPVLGLRPMVDFSGSLDFLIDQTTLDDVSAVLREGLTNVAKHANARSVAVEVVAEQGRLAVQVLDDGVGFDRDRPHSGLANLRARAEQYGGDLAVGNRPEGGLALQWTIPMPA